MQLREVYREISEQINQFILGLNSPGYTSIKTLILKGAEKGIEDCQTKYKSCKNIEDIGEEAGGKIADFFDIIYEKFEKEIEDFFSKREGDVQEASQFYRLRTKYLDRKVVGLQSQLVKQNFEIQNSRTFYKQEVELLQCEIGDIKKDFSQTLIDVKSSMLNYAGEDDITSTPDIEYTNNSVDEFNLNQNDDEKLSALGKNSFLGASLQINQQYSNIQYNTMNDGQSNLMTQRSRNSTHKYDYDSYRKSTISKNSDMNYENSQSNYYMDSRRKGDNTTSHHNSSKHHGFERQSSNNLSVVTGDKKPPLRNTYTFNHHYYQQHLQNNQQQTPQTQQIPNTMNYLGGSGLKDSHNQSQQDLNSSRQSRNSRGSRHTGAVGGNTQMINTNGRNSGQQMHNHNHHGGSGNGTQTTMFSNNLHQAYGATSQSQRSGYNPCSNTSVHNEYQGGVGTSSVSGIFKKHRGSHQTQNTNNMNISQISGNGSNHSNIFSSRRSTQKSNRAPSDRLQFSKQDSLKKEIMDKPPIMVQQTVSDEDFSNILGGMHYINKTSTIELTSEISHLENNDDTSKSANTKPMRNDDQLRHTHNIFSMAHPHTETTDLRIPLNQQVNPKHEPSLTIKHQTESSTMLFLEDERGNSIKRVQSSGQLLTANQVFNIVNQTKLDLLPGFGNHQQENIENQNLLSNDPSDSLASNSVSVSNGGTKTNKSNMNNGGGTGKHNKKISKFSLTFCNPSPVESRDCSKERPQNSLLSQIALAQALQQNAQQNALNKINQQSFSKQDQDLSTDKVKMNPNATFEPVHEASTNNSNN